MASRSYRYLRLGRPRSGLTSLDSYYTTEPTTAAAEECTWPDHFALHLALPDQSAIRQNVPVLVLDCTPTMSRVATRLWRDACLRSRLLESNHRTIA